jgi:hypothetical protein
VSGFGQAYRLALRRRDTLAFISLAVVTLTFLQWLNGGQYSIAFLLWLTLGWIDRHANTQRRPEATAAP